uniref:Uncharacterized protein n=1 Tax=Anguilla anguilla TaxID=7936 RepID=A0A0E9SEI5_ANGAN
MEYGITGYPFPIVYILLFIISNNRLLLLTILPIILYTQLYHPHKSVHAALPTMQKRHRLTNTSSTLHYPQCIEHCLT